MANDGSGNQLELWPVPEPPQGRASRPEPEIIPSDSVRLKDETSALPDPRPKKLVKASEDYYVPCPRCGDASMVRQIHLLSFGEVLCCDWCGWQDARAQKKQPRTVKAIAASGSGEGSRLPEGYSS